MKNKILTGILNDLKSLMRGYKKANGEWDIKKIFIDFGPYLIMAYMVNKICYGYRITPGTEFWPRMILLFQDFGRCFRWPFPSLNKIDFLWGIIAGVGFKLFVIYKKKNAKHFRQGEEHGSARWANPKEAIPLMAPRFEDNIILTQTEGLRIVGRTKDMEYQRNTHVLIIGGSGSGKTRFFVIPNLMQMYGCYIVTDPKGTLVKKTGRLFARGVPKINPNGETAKDKNGKTIYEPYKIKVFNTIKFEESMHYNPFVYFKDEKDIQEFVTILVLNTKKDPNSKGEEDFWAETMEMLFVAYIAYIWYEAPEEEQNIGMLLYMLTESEVREEDETFENPIDLLFNELEEKDPENFALMQYKSYKKAAGKTAKSIIISCAARLSAFAIPQVREIVSYDELELDKIGEERTILYIIISDMSTTYNFLVGILYSQLFKMLCEKADQYPSERLPYNVSLMLDEFANIGKIPDFQTKIATIRSRGISANIILQSKSQLKSLYKEDADTIASNCDTFLYLGGGGAETLEEISKRLGKETIDTESYNESKGSTESSGSTQNKSGRELLTPDEVAYKVKRKECILLINNTRPFKSLKYNPEQHKNYKYLSDYDIRNTFNVKKYLKNYKKPVLKDDTKILVINAD